LSITQNERKTRLASGVRATENGMGWGQDRRYTAKFVVACQRDHGAREPTGLTILLRTEGLASLAADLQQRAAA
jgi:hypothetical protein